MIRLNMRIAITGGSGFLGKHVTQYFLENSSHRLIFLKRLNTDISWITSEFAPRCEFYNIDVDHEFKAYLSEGNVEVILHMATNYGREEYSVGEVLAANLRLPLMLLENAVKRNIPHFINIDSYFNKPGNSYSHLMNYSNSKKSLTLWFPHFGGEMKVTNVVLEHVYGPFDRKDKFVPTFIESARCNFGDGVKFSEGGQVRDFIYVEDVASALLAVVEGKTLGPDFEEINLGTSVGTTLRDFGETVCRALRLSVKPPFGAGKYRKGEIMASVADSSSMSKYDWGPKYSLEQGIGNLLE